MHELAKMAGFVRPGNQGVSVLSEYQWNRFGKWFIRQALAPILLNLALAAAMITVHASSSPGFSPLSCSQSKP